MPRARIAILANCQGRPLANFLSLLSGAVEISGVAVTHLVKPQDSGGLHRVWEQSDLIFAQFVSDKYPLSFLKTSYLKSAFGAKVVSWPNLFFKGQGPDICYLTPPQGGRVLGPLVEYQNLPVYQYWRGGKPVAEAVALLKSDTSWIAALKDSAESSIENLRKREKSLDTGISDVLAERWRTARLFYTFNHPTKMLLGEMAGRLLKFSGIASAWSDEIAAMPEPLDKVIPALLPAVAEALGLDLPTGTMTKGYEVDTGGGVKIGKKVRHYDLEEFVEVSFRCLDAQVNRDAETKIT